MRPLRLLLAACLLAPSVGCESFRKWIGKDTQPGPTHTSAIPNATPEQLVGYLNGHAAQLRTLNYGEVSVSAKEGEGVVSAIKQQVYPTLTGHLSASQPRNFRMVVGKGGLVDAKFDFGSNPQQFWVYFTAPTVQPMYVFASHSDFQDGKVKLPGNMPFDPDWVMQALGMTTFPEGGVPYEVRTDERARAYTLSWPGTTPNGVPVRKEIVFAADEADPRYNQPQVRKHLVRDAKTNAVIASAEVKSANSLPTGSDAATGRTQTIQYPTHIVLRWEQQKFEMTMKLGAPKVNQQMSPKDFERLFDLPNIAGVQPQNLAHARYDAPGK